MTSARASTASSKAWRGAIAAAAVACGLPLLLGARGWIRDDRVLIADNALLARGARALPEIWTTGYWEAARGTAATIEEYRPLLSTTFLAQLGLGRAPAPFHAVDLGLHAAVCLLLFAALRRRMQEAAAGAAALLFAVLPVHAEATFYATSRSELLTALALLGCWELLGESEQRGQAPPLRFYAGLAVFAAGLLCKESAAVIPAFLALADWTFHGKRPWDAGRRRVYAGLAAVGAAWLLLRAAVLPRFSAGAPFFATRLDAALAWPALAAVAYIKPLAAGRGLCADLTVPGSGLTVPHDIQRAFASVILLGLPVACMAWGLWRRRQWAFWLAAPCLFLLPTCPILVPLDAVAAERFLYVPSIAWCVPLGYVFERALRRSRLAAVVGLALLVCYYAVLLAERSVVWLDEIPYYEAALNCNPGSAKAASGLGAALLSRGDERGVAALERATRLDPGLADPVYNLALHAWLGGDVARTDVLAHRAVELDPGLSDGHVLLGLVAERRGAPAEAKAHYERALSLLPYNDTARFNLQRLAGAHP